MHESISSCCRAALTILVAAGVTHSALSQTATAVPEESPAQRAQRMQWFEQARFGMFIHWGVYSVPAGEYGGATSYGEWIMEQAKIPVSSYERFSAQFNPVKFDAREWVRMAKDAGMKYIVITSKHHDGFCLWDSAQTDWDIRRTPFRRDPLKELSQACADAGIRFCFYYSIMDWHHPDWGQRRAWNDLASGTPDMDRYTDYMKGQLRELLTGYGPIGILWFDGEWERPWTQERGVDLYNYCRGLQPALIVNNRVGKGRAGMSGMDRGEGVGDYGTPEQEIPATGFGPGVAWESCMTMNDHWGYNQRDHHWKSATTLVRNLIDCASKGGNYLLNVGPTAEGLFPEASVERLAAIGSWMKVNGEAIYGTEASPFSRLEWGRCTQRAAGDDTDLYLHVFDWPAAGRLVVPGLRSPVLSARLLASGQSAAIQRNGDDVEIDLPATAPDALSTTIVLRIQGRPDVAPFCVKSRPDGSLRLEAVTASLHGSQLRTESGGGRLNLGYWVDPAAWAEWPVQVDKPGSYQVEAEISALTSGKFTIEVDGQTLAAQSPSTGAYSEYRVVTLGSLRLDAGPHTVRFRPVASGWSPLNLRWLEFKPVAAGAR